MVADLLTLRSQLSCILYVNYPVCVEEARSCLHFGRDDNLQNLLDTVVAELVFMTLLKITSGALVKPAHNVYNEWY